MVNVSQILDWFQVNQVHQLINDLVDFKVKLLQPWKLIIFITSLGCHNWAFKVELNFEIVLTSLLKNKFGPITIEV